MLTKSLYLICLIGLVFGYSTCREEKTAEDAASADTFIESARLYFESYVDVPGASFNTANPLVAPQRVAAWDEAYFYELFDGVSAVAVPVRFTGNNTLHSNITSRPIALSKITRLLMYQDNHKTWHAEVVTLLPQPGYSAADGAAFSGVVLVHDWYGNKLKQLQYTPDGKQTLLTSRASATHLHSDGGALHGLSICLMVYGDNQPTGRPDNGTMHARTTCETLNANGDSQGKYSGVSGGVRAFALANGSNIRRPRRP